MRADIQQCALCGSYIVGLASHVFNHHKKTMPEYRILTKDIDLTKLILRRKALWE